MFRGIREIYHFIVGKYLRNLMVQYILDIPDRTPFH